ISRRAFSQLPQSPPIPQRSSFSRQLAPAATMLRMTRSEAPRQMQTIIVLSFLIETESQSLREHDRAGRVFRQVFLVTHESDRTTPRIGVVGAAASAAPRPLRAAVATDMV